MTDALEPHNWSITGNLRPLPHRVLVCDMEQGNKTLASGLIIPDDNGVERGIRPRQCRVYAVGSNVDYLKPGDQILVAHGRWTRGVRINKNTPADTVVRMVDTKDILLVIEP